MSIKIVTAKKGEPHITSSDDGAMHQGIFGTDDYILDVGEKFRVELASNNEVKIYDGEGMLQGRHWRIEPGTYESVTIDNGNQGMNRKDLIVARYSKDSLTGNENIELKVLKGTQSSGNAIQPVPQKGDLRKGDLEHNMALYVVSISGLNVTSIDMASSIIGSFSGIKDYVVEESIDDLSSMYRKWNSGLLEVWLSALYSMPVNIAWGSCYRTDNANGKEYPVAFKEVPHVITSVKTDANDACWHVERQGERKDRTPDYYFVRPDQIGFSAKFYVSTYAVGRWK